MGRAVILAVLLLGGVHPATAQSFRVGAAKVEITPPLFDAAADAAMFPLCPPSVFDGPRIFGLQEPCAVTGSRLSCG